MSCQRSYDYEVSCEIFLTLDNDPCGILLTQESKYIIEHSIKFNKNHLCYANVSCRRASTHYALNLHFVQSTCLSEYKFYFFNLRVE
jgi:hypothetical protein